MATSVPIDMSPCLESGWSPNTKPAFLDKEVIGTADKLQANIGYLGISVGSYETEFYQENRELGRDHWERRLGGTPLPWYQVFAKCFPALMGDVGKNWVEEKLAGLLETWTLKVKTIQKNYSNII